MLSQHNITSQTQMPAVHIPGGRTVSPHHLKQIERAEAFNGLPDGVSRYDILDLLDKVGRELGFSDSLIRHLIYLVRRTQDQDWEAGARPIFFAHKSTIALDMGISEEQVRNRERRLHALGALTWSDSPNHKRGGWRDPETGALKWAYGVDLSPMAALYQTMLETDERLTDERKTRKRIKARLNNLRSQVRNLIPVLEQYADTDQDGELDRQAKAYRRIYDEHHRKPARTSTSVAAMERWIAELTILRSDLKALVDDIPKWCREAPSPDHDDRPLQPDEDRPQTGPKDASPLDDSPVDKSPLPQKTWTTVQENDDHSYNIQTTTRSLRDTCKHGGKAERQEGGCSNTQARKPAPVVARGGRVADPERVGLRRTGLQHLTFWQCLDAAEPAFRRFLPDVPEELLGWGEFVEAAADLRPILGISLPIWREAMDTLGREAAAVCVMLTARGATTSPGGYFRRMVERGIRGELNLHQSVFAILKRSRFDA